MDIDYAPTLDFLGNGGRAHQLRFRPDAHGDDSGQLIPVITRCRPDNHRTVATSRAGVNVQDVEAALAGRHIWTRLTNNLPHIRHRIHAAGPG